MFGKIIQLFTEQRAFKKLANKSKRYLQLGTLFRRITQDLYGSVMGPATIYICETCANIFDEMWPSLYLTADFIMAHVLKVC